MAGHVYTQNVTHRRYAMTNDRFESDVPRS